jgi:hypothetical protein
MPVKVISDAQRVQCREGQEELMYPVSFVSRY